MDARRAEVFARAAQVQREWDEAETKAKELWRINDERERAEKRAKQEADAEEWRRKCSSPEMRAKIEAELAEWRLSAQRERLQVVK